MFHTHTIQHRVINIDTLSAYVHDLTGLESTIGTRDSVEDSGKLSLYVGVTTITRFSRHGKKSIL